MKKTRKAEISRRMKLLWGDRERTPRGPKPALSVDHIVQRAMEIADKQGIQAVTMQSVSKRSGVTTMALYRYVASKSELVDAMVEAALGQPPAMGSTREWRSNLATWARGNLSIYQRHPWVLYAIIASPPFGPNQLAWLEAALGALSGVRISDGEKVAVISLVDDHVRGSAQLLLTFQATPQFGEWYEAAMARASTDERYPRIAELVTGGTVAETGDTSWNPFEFGLERLLDGVGSFIKARGRD